MARPMLKKKLAEIGAAVDAIDIELHDSNDIIARKTSEIWTLRANIAKHEKARAALLVEFALQTGLLEARIAPSPNGIIADGDPLTDAELAELDAKITEATAPDPTPTVEEVPF